MPYEMDRLYELAQMFSMFHFFYIVRSIRNTMPQKLGLYFFYFFLRNYISN